MLQDIIFVQPLNNYQLHLRFEDNLEGIIDLQQQIEFSGVFEPLKNPDYFAQVKVNPELGTIQWPNGADLDPDVLYSVLSNTPLDLYTHTANSL
jgi:hypothetical protein